MQGTGGRKRVDYRAEVLGMLLEEFDVDKYERSIKAEGRVEGIAEGIEQTIKLTGILLESNRIEDLQRMTTDQEYRDKLFQELGI